MADGGQIVEQETTEKSPGCHVRDWLPPVLLLFAAIMNYPGITFSYPYWNVSGVTSGAAVLLAAGLLLLSPGRLLDAWRRLPAFARIAGAVLTGIGAYHWVGHASSYTVNEGGFCLLYAVLPLFGLAYADALKKILPYVLAGCWVLNTSLCLVQRQVYGQLFFGIPANINWNAAFVLISTAFTLLLLWKLTVHQRILRLLGLSIIGGLSAWIFIDCASRAAILGVVVTSLVAGYLEIRRPGRKKVYLWCCLLLALAGAAVLAIALKNPDIKKTLMRDDRVFLVYTTADMIADAPLLGRGLPSFEQEYLAYRVPAYFTLRYCAVRTNHPHNDLLFAAAGFGLIGLAAWLILLLTPLIRVSRRWRKYDTSDKMLCAAFAVLAIHAQFDLIFFHLPTNVFGLVFLGMLWSLTTPKPTFRPATPGFRAVSISAGAVMGGLALYVITSVVWSSQLVWLGQGALMRHDLETAKKYFARAEAIPELRLNQRYDLMLYAKDYWMDSETVIRIASQIAKSSTPDYAHVNIFRGALLSRLGRYKEAEKYMLRDIEIFHLHVVPLMMISDLYLKLNEPEKFNMAQKCIREIMEKRGLDARDIELILAHPEYDSRPWDIPAEQRTPRVPQQQ